MSAGEKSRSVAEEEGLSEKLAEVETELRLSRARVKGLEESLAAQRRTIERMRGTIVWRLGAHFWALRDRALARSPLLRRAYALGGAGLKGALRPLLSRASLLAPPPADYQAWIARNELSARQLAELRAVAARLPRPPLFSVVVPVHDIAEPWLRACVDSVRRQGWQGWELCAVDDGSPAPHVWRILQEYARQDSRVRAERAERSGGIVAATQSALAMARGDFIVFLDHDDELAPEALLVVAAKLGAEPDLDLVYSDEDKIDERGRRVEPFFKPEWSPDLLLSMNYVSHLTVVRRTLLDAVGGLRTGFEGSQDYDLVLRLVERTQRIGHVPRVLYHWRKVPGSTAVVPEAKPYALDSASRALEEALARRETPGRVSSSAPGLYHVRYDVRGQPLVSIVMPTRNKADMLRTCVESIESRTRWGCWELTVVDNGSTDPEALAYLEELGRRHRVIRDERPFNWSALNNAAARGVCGDHLLFMNNDMEVISDEWLEALLEHAQRPEVGAVGARLLYPDGTVQHAGVVLGVGGVANHAFRALAAEDPGYFGLAHVARDVSAVTGACLMTRREAFERQGGFDEQLGVAFNDIDYCLRLGRAGLRVVYTPFALLCHHESATRGTLHPQENEEFMWAQWRSVIEDDPYYSPNLTRARLDYAIRG